MYNQQTNIQRRENQHVDANTEERDATHKISPVLLRRSERGGGVQVDSLQLAFVGQRAGNARTLAAYTRISQNGKTNA